MIGIALLFETDVGTMLVQQLRMLGRHRAKYNTQATVFIIIVSSKYSSHLRCCVPRWYNAGPPSPDAGPALNQRLCRREH